MSELVLVMSGVAIAISAWASVLNRRVNRKISEYAAECDVRYEAEKKWLKGEIARTEASSAALLGKRP